MVNGDTDSRILTDFLAAMVATDSLDEGFVALREAVEAMGFSGVFYSAAPLTLRAAGPIDLEFFSTPSFRDFSAHYEQADLGRDDFTVERIRAGRLDVLDWQEERRRVDERHRAMIDIARAEGVRHALTIPTAGGEHLISGACVASDESDARFARLKRERLPLLEVIVEFFHRWAFSHPDRRRAFYRPLIDQFDRDAACVMRLVASGQPLKTSRDLYGISPTRAGNILSRLYRRYGISNAAELAYLTGIHRLDRWLPAADDRYGKPASTIDTMTISIPAPLITDR